MNAFGRFLKCSISEKLLIIETVCFLGSFRLLILAVPFRKLVHIIGIPGKESSMDIPESAECIADIISKAVTRTAHHTWWESKCLVQAFTASFMLRRRKVESTLYMGVTIDENHNMTAHAWLRCGNTIITGDSEKDRFAIVGRFSRPL